MRHSGVCVQRQYAAYAGIVHGQKTRAFFAKLVRRGFASAFECRHNRGRVYHVHHHALYSAVEAPNSRYRRPVSASRTTERLMMLDALLGTGDVVWFATNAELRNHFRPLVSPVGSDRLQDAEPLSSLDSLRVDSTRIGIDQAGRTVLLYLVLPGSREDRRMPVTIFVQLSGCSTRPRITRPRRDGQMKSRSSLRPQPMPHA